MPRKPIDYSKGLIYKIVCKDLECKDIYVGSTTSFRRRKYEHKSHSHSTIEKYQTYKLYICIKENGGWDNFDMIEIEKYPCNDANELRARERYYYEQLKGTLNGNVPNRSKKEYLTMYNIKKRKK